MSLLQKRHIKRLYSAEETCIFEEPTNHSHPMRPMSIISYRVAKTHKKPYVAGHFLRKSPKISASAANMLRNKSHIPMMRHVAKHETCFVSLWDMVWGMTHVLHVGIWDLFRNMFRNRGTNFRAWIWVYETYTRRHRHNGPLHTADTDTHIWDTHIWVYETYTHDETQGAGVENQENKKISVPLSKKDQNKKTYERWT